MSRRRRKAQGSRSATQSSVVTPKPTYTFVADGPLDVAVRYAEACGLAAQGRIDEARRIYAELDAVLTGSESEARVRALIRSDVAAIAAIEGHLDDALAGWRTALEIDPDCLMAQLNRDLIEAELSFEQMSGDLGELKLAPAPVPSPLVGEVASLPSPLVGEGTQEYYSKLRQSLSEAEAVLVLNPVIAALLEPYCGRVRIVPWGMDAARFPWPAPEGERADSASKPTRLFIAAVAGETIKGYHVAHEACRILRQWRADFELVVTFDQPGPIDEFTRSVGWCSLAELPRHYREADICLVPTIAQDSLSRTSVEAMASGIPVIASRIGRLPYTVTDGVTGLLFEPGDPGDLARKITRLLDDPEWRRRMGLAGRRRFEEDFVWKDVIERYFRPLLTRQRVGGNSM